MALTTTHSKAPSNGARTARPEIEAFTTRTLDDFISRINPKPSEEDTDDIFAIQQAVTKMVLRRNAQLVKLVLEKDKKIAELCLLLEKAHEEPPAPPAEDPEDGPHDGAIEDEE